MPNSLHRNSSFLLLGMLLLALPAVPVLVQAEPQDRSTVDNIPLKSMDQAALAGTVIEGGLAPGATTRPDANALAEGLSPYYDPLLIPADDNRSGANRFPLDVDIRFQNPKSIPGIEFGSSYRIEPPMRNRVYDFYDYRTTER